MKRLDCSTGYLVEMVSKVGFRYRFGVRKKYLDAFIASALEHNCTLEIIGFCKMPRNSGIKFVGSNE